MTNPPSTPSGFTAEAGLVLDCPHCGSVSDDQGFGTYRCAENGHTFEAGRCPVCGSPAISNGKRFRCTESKSHRVG